MPAPTHPTIASRLSTCVIARARLLWGTFVQKWHQTRATRPVPRERRRSSLRHARKAATSPAPQPSSHPATQQIGIPHNPLYDLPALPPFRSAEASLCTGTRAILLSAQASAMLDAMLRRLRQLLEVSQRRHLTPERLLEVCLLMGAADLQTCGADSQIVRSLGHQVTAQPASWEMGEGQG